MLWMNETIAQQRLRVKIPNHEELERMYPMCPVDKIPDRPRDSRPVETS